MNQVRRKALEEILTRIEDCKNDLESLRDEEQEYLDNMPESLQSSEKHEAAENAVSELDTAIDDLEEAGSSVDGAAQ